MSDAGSWLQRLLEFLYPTHFHRFHKQVIARLELLLDTQPNDGQSSSR